MPLTDLTPSHRSVGLDETRLDQLHERLTRLERRIDDRLAQLDSRVGRLEHRLTEHLISGLGLWAVTTTAIAFVFVILFVVRG